MNRPGMNSRTPQPKRAYKMICALLEGEGKNFTQEQKRDIVVRIERFGFLEKWRKEQR